MLKSTLNKVIYTGDGSVTEFPVPFKFFSNRDGSTQLMVWIEEVSGYIHEAIENVDYTVSGGGVSTGGTITFLKAPDSNIRIAISRNTSFLQEVNFLNGENFDAEQYENSLDEIVMSQQQILEKIDRAILLDTFSDEDPNTIIETVSGYKNSAVVSANEARSSAESARIAAENAEGSYVAVQEAVEKAEGNINTTAADAVNSITELGDEKVETAKSWAVGDETERPEGSAKKWSEIAKELAESINPGNFANIDFDNTNMVDYIVDNWTSDDGKSWYRLFKSGRKQQGGNFTAVSSGIATINLFLPFSNSFYYVAGSNTYMGSDRWGYRDVGTVRTSTSFSMGVVSGYDNFWIAEGF